MMLDTLHFIKDKPTEKRLMRIECLSYSIRRSTVTLTLNFREATNQEKGTR